jgi:hypothetical protein
MSWLSTKDSKYAGEHLIGNAFRFLLAEGDTSARVACLYGMLTQHISAGSSEPAKNLISPRPPVMQPEAFS